MANRRDWIKSAAAVTAGMTFAGSLVNQLMASPVSIAEKWHGINRPGQLIRLGSNENPYGPSEKARQAVLNSLSEGNRYSHNAAGEVKNAIASKLHVSADHIILGSGSSELLCLAGMFTGIEGGAILSAFPTFRLLMDYGAKFNARWDKVNLDEFMKHDLSAMLSAIRPDTKMIFVVNPNNPTGTVVDNDQLKSFCIEASKKAIVFVDEAYIEFLDNPEEKSMVQLVKQGHNIIVSRTFSKVYGLAGLRAGYLIGSPDLMKKISEKQVWGNYNQAGLAAAVASLEDHEFVKMTKQKNAEALDYFSLYLKKNNWLIGQSFANVVLFPAPLDGKTILEETEKRGFQIRIWDYQDKEWCRVSIGTLDEMKAFTNAFDQIV
jgi:histidinol-phosphate aminotransferase